jgi:hypothetical protein
MAKIAKEKETAVSPVGVAIDDLNKRYRALNARRDALTARILKLEGGNYTMFSPVTPETKQQRVAAAKLLNGGFADVAKKAAGEDLADLHQERKVIDLALGMADVKMQSLVTEEDNERREAMRDEWIAAQAQVAHCLLALELALQGTDRVWDKMAPRSGLYFEPNPNQSWNFDRFVTRAGRGFRFCENAVAQGWLSKKDFDQAMSDLRAGKI